MDIAWIEAYCLAKKGVEKNFKVEWDALRYMVGNKMFLMQGEDKLKKALLTLKLDPLRGRDLRERYASIVPGYYMNKEHWNSFYSDENDLPEELLKAMIDESYNLVFASLAKKEQKSILEA